MLKHFNHILLGLLACLALTGCIENDIPYPIVRINLAQVNFGLGDSVLLRRTVKGDTLHLYVSDLADLRRIKLQSLTTELTYPVAVISVLDSSRCADYDLFPRLPFDSLEHLPAWANTTIDWSDTLRGVRFRFSTYQDYDYRVIMHHWIERNIAIEGMLTNAVVDQNNRSVVIYVAKSEDLSRLKVNAFELAGAHGVVTPDPTESETFDFSEPRTFKVKHHWTTEEEEWKVFVYRREFESKDSIYPWATRATIEGRVTSGVTLQIEYRQQGNEEWTQLNENQIQRQGVSFVATLLGLQPETTYECRSIHNGEAHQTISFTTAGTPTLPNMNFDEWNLQGDDKRPLWCPWKEGDDMFWDTGNHGATTVGPSNSVPTTETCNGQGFAALLESKYIVIKFAAGNIFTGKYKSTDGTNGILDFGRPFSGFPTKLRINYKCQTGEINKCASDKYRDLVGRPDSCQIYIALTDWDEPFEIRTRPSNLQLFDPNDPHVLAYAEIIKGENVDNWTQEDLELEWRDYKRTPKYILIVASSSKYGDFFTGSDKSKLWVDNFELIYD